MIVNDCNPLQTDAHLTKIQHHITGVKDHGSDKNYIFTWTDLFHPNANITMNCLEHVLDNICKVCKLPFCIGSAMA